MPTLTKLMRFSYRTVYSKGSLSSFQLHFTDEVESQVFEASKSKASLTHIEIDTERTIRKISLKIAYNEEIRGLRLMDEFDEFIVDVTWCEHSDIGEWVTKQIPKGLEIIGVRCRTQHYYTIIPRIDFLLWKPEPLMHFT